jgi:hypothetical protein
MLINLYTWPLCAVALFIAVLTISTRCCYAYVLLQADGDTALVFTHQRRLDKKTKVSSHPSWIVYDAVNVLSPHTVLLFAIKNCVSAI